MNPWTVVSASAEIDVATVGPLRDALARAVAAGSDILVDLDQTSFMDSSGLGAIVEACRALGAGRRLAVWRPQPRVRRLLELSGLDDMIIEDADVHVEAAAT